MTLANLLALLLYFVARVSVFASNTSENSIPLGVFEATYTPPLSPESKQALASAFDQFIDLYISRMQNHILRNGSIETLQSIRDEMQEWRGRFARIEGMVRGETAAAMYIQIIDNFLIFINNTILISEVAEGKADLLPPNNNGNNEIKVSLANLSEEDFLSHFGLEFSVIEQQAETIWSQGATEGKCHNALRRLEILRGRLEEVKRRVLPAFDPNLALICLPCLLDATQSRLDSISERKNSDSPDENATSRSLVSAIVQAVRPRGFAPPSPESMHAYAQSAIDHIQSRLISLRRQESANIQQIGNLEAAFNALVNLRDQLRTRFSPVLPNQPIIDNQYQHLEVTEGNVRNIMHLARILSIQMVTPENAARHIADVETMVEVLRRVRELPNADPLEVSFNINWLEETKRIASALLNQRQPTTTNENDTAGFLSWPLIVILGGILLLIAALVLHFSTSKTLPLPLQTKEVTI